jgi:hypothetical protein
MAEMGLTADALSLDEREKPVFCLPGAVASRAQVLPVKQALALCPKTRFLRWALGLIDKAGHSIYNNRAA